MDDSSPDWPGVRLHVVTGKGGTGKTTVAAALALTLASLGRKVLLAEVEGRQGISQAFDVAPLPDEEKLVLRVSSGGEVWGLSVDAKAALLEYLEIFYRLGRAGSALERMGAIDFATTIAPGVRDVLLIGKVYEAARRRRDGKDSGPWVYDAVVLDAPPTGRVANFLNVNDEVAELAKVGPIRNQADSITRLLRSGAAVVHLTTLLEDMPVQETLDAVGDLERIKVPLGAFIVNQARPEILSEDLSADLLRPGGLTEGFEAQVEHAMASALGDTGAGAGADLLAEAADHAVRLELEDRLLRDLEAHGSALYVLPHLADESGPGRVRTLAQHLAEQAVWT
ncbi:MAG: ArsA-related P-loop ATPase [Mobilicoccus sp.]|nr:ArsA-related P-loop ATPase [Mobilicoccus sp.]